MRALLMCTVLAVVAGPSFGSDKDSVVGTRLDRGYATDFAALEVDPVAIETEGRASGGLGPEADVWRAVIPVVMQRGPIVRLDPSHGLLLAPPYVVLVKEVSPSGTFGLYVEFLTDLYRTIGKPERLIIKMKPAAKELLLRELVAQIVTEFNADARLSPGGAWSYLED